MRRILAVTIVAASFARVSMASAQGDDSGIGYISLVTTPSAGVPPLVRQWMLSDPRSKIGFDAQWGHLSGIGADLNMFTGGVTFPVNSGKADFGLSAGYDKLSCSECGGTFVAGAVYEGSLKQSVDTGSTFTLGLSGRLGYAQSSFASGSTAFLSASVGLPLSLAFGQGDATRIVPFLTPAFGIGHAGSEIEATGVRFLVGGGVGIVNQAAGISVTVGAQRVIIDGGKFVVGLGLSLMPR